jgi:hypothetical protein
VRNNVMHFEPDSPTDKDRKVLREFRQLLYELVERSA